MSLLSLLAAVWVALALAVLIVMTVGFFMDIARGVL